MAVNAPINQYRDEFIYGFEQNQSLVRESVTSEAVIKGNQAIFLVSDSNSANAVTRGIQGLIPARADNNQQLTATLTERHDLVRKTGFNVFESQGNQRRLMQMTCMATINREIDQDVISALSAATQTTGAAATGSMALVMKALTILGNQEVPYDGQIYALITPGLLAYLLQTKEFNSADYVNVKPLPTATLGKGDKGWGYYEWMGVKWIVHPNLAGKGTSSETCYMYHKNAIGHAANVQGIDYVLGYDSEQDYSYARCSIFMGSKLLQNSGVCKIVHDGSAFA